MGAILALGARRDPTTAVPLALCALAHPVDLQQGLHILEAIDGMPPGPDRAAALRMLGEHPGAIMRRRATGLLEP
jgi:hypothetical protein